MDPVIFASVTLALAAASATDLRTMRIPNVLTLPTAVLALCYHALTSGVGGLWFSTVGLAVGLALMLAPFLFGVMGGGDAKLMAAVGAWIGPVLTLEAFVLTTLVGGGYALFELARRPAILRGVLARFRVALFATTATGQFHYTQDASSQRLPRLCYGLAIALGTLLAMGREALTLGLRPAGF